MSAYIIPPKQVDIPILINRKCDNTLFKFAVEYNGGHFHKERDKIKETKLLNNGWKHMVIWDFTNNKKNKEYGKIECQIEDLCKQVKEYVDNCIV